jgi:hypothetical protein
MKKLKRGRRNKGIKNLINNCLNINYKILDDNFLI